MLSNKIKLLSQITQKIPALVVKQETLKVRYHGFNQHQTKKLDYIMFLCCLICLFTSVENLISFENKMQLGLDFFKKNCQTILYLFLPSRHCPLFVEINKQLWLECDRLLVMNEAAILGSAQMSVCILFKK